MSIGVEGRRRIWLAAVVSQSQWRREVPQPGGLGRSFIFLQSGFTQDLFGTAIMPVDPPGDPTDPSSKPVPHILGGVAFAPNGDIWSADCQFLGTSLRRFSRTSTISVHGSLVHQMTDVVDLSVSGLYHDQPDWFPWGIAGCGLVNHPDGFMSSNSSGGVWKLDPASGRPVDGMGLPVTLSGGGLATPKTTTTASDGSYSFTSLAAATNYSAFAPASAAGLSRSTTCPLALSLPAGGMVP